MTLTADGWFDFAIRDPGPLSKTSGGRNRIRGVVPHSAEGYWPHLQELLHDEARRASWFASNLKDGRLFQHYPVYTQTWTSGCAFLNNDFPAWENEGVAGEPLTAAQFDNNVKIIGGLSALGGWSPRRPTDAQDLTATCYEHNESTRFGGKFTVCPSNRIDWPRTLAALEPEEDEMKPFLAWNIDNKSVHLIGPFGSAWITQAADVAALEKLYGPMAVALRSAAITELRRT